MGVRLKRRGRLTADDRAMLAELVREMGPRLLAYVRRVYATREDAEDIVAEAICRAASNIEALRASPRRDLYLLTVARNLCRDGFRRQRPIAMPADELQRFGSAADVSAPAAEAEQSRALRAAVAALPESLREVVVLRLSTGLTFEEIAELLHVPLGTALSRMHAAVQRLRAVLRCVHGA